MSGILNLFWDILTKLKNFASSNSKTIVKQFSDVLYRIFLFDMCAIFSALYDNGLLIKKFAQTIYFQHSFFDKISFHKNLKSLETFLESYQEVERGEDSHAREACGGEVHPAPHIGHHNLFIKLL